MTENDPNPEAATAPNGPLPEERRARTLIVVGAASNLAGIALAVMGDGLGRWLVVAGVVLSFIALHRFGRLGPDITISA